MMPILTPVFYEWFRVLDAEHALGSRLQDTRYVALLSTNESTLQSVSNPCGQAKKDIFFWISGINHID